MSGKKGPDGPSDLVRTCLPERSTGQVPGLLLQVPGRISPWVLEKGHVPLVLNPNTFPEPSAPRPPSEAPYPAPHSLQPGLPSPHN